MGKNYPRSAAAVMADYEKKQREKREAKEAEERDYSRSVNEKRLSQKDRELDLREREVKVMEEDAANTRRIADLLEEIKEISTENNKLLKEIKGDSNA